MKNRNIKIFGDKWKIKYVPRVQIPDMEEGFFYRGVSNPAERVIQIATSGVNGEPLEEQDMRYTLAHECIHAILATGMYEDLNRNEPLVEYLAKNIVQLIDQKII